jgi:hypothetical protein
LEKRVKVIIIVPMLPVKIIIVEAVLGVEINERISGGKLRWHIFSIQYASYGPRQWAMCFKHW